MSAVASLAEEGAKARAARLAAEHAQSSAHDILAAAIEEWGGRRRPCQLVRG